MNAPAPSASENKNLNFAAFFVQIVGIMFLCGWIFNAAIIRKIDPAISSMNPLTAASLILFGLLVILRNSDLNSDIKKTLNLLISLIIIVPVVLTLIDLIFNTSFNADRFFSDHRDTTFKMSAVTAVALACSGAAWLLLTASTRKTYYVSQMLVFASLYLTSVCLFGYLYNINSLTSIASSNLMPLHTALTLTIINVVMLLQNPDEGFMRAVMSIKSGGNLVRNILPYLIVAPLVLGFTHLIFFKYNNIERGYYTAVLCITIVLVSFITARYFAKVLNKLDGTKDEVNVKLVDTMRQAQRFENIITEMGNMAKVGVWETYISDHIPSFWSEQVYSIYKLHSNVLLSFDTMLKYYKPDSKRLLAEHYQKTLSDGTPFELELRLLTSNAKEIWVQVVGKPIFDNSNTVIGVRGTLQDIDDQKRRELLLQISIDLIEDQNKRLLGFSHIVSHNLLNHSSNLIQTLNLLGTRESDQNVSSLIDNIRDTGESISVAIKHLNEVVRIETNIDHTKSKSEVNFKDTLKQVTDVLKPEIASSDLTINSDFSECETIHYLPEYLESILLNFTHNTIKYKEAGIPAVVNIKTNVVNNKTILTFSDNTMGADLNKDRDKVLGMYKAYQNNADAKGTWLFLAKSQVESLGGNIEIQSAADEGTAFKITF